MLLIYKIPINVKVLSSIGYKMQNSETELTRKQPFIYLYTKQIFLINRYLSRTSYMPGTVSKHSYDPVLMECDEGDNVIQKTDHMSHVELEVGVAKV